MFNGISSGSLKTAQTAAGVNYPYWEMIFNFSASENAIINVNGVAVPKGGWQYLWTTAPERGRPRGVR